MKSDVGLSTLMIQQAVNMNKGEDPVHKTRHICVEPFENKWLEKLSVSVKRTKVEDLHLDFFATLEKGDFLFIDSSHVIRPQGDVLFEYLEILPVLKPGVIVHIHDIFSPKDYPLEWVVDQGRNLDRAIFIRGFSQLQQGLSCSRRLELSPSSP